MGAALPWLGKLIGVALSSFIEPFSRLTIFSDVLGQYPLRGGPREVAILCDMHSLMPVGFSHVFIYG